jgi:hypothetical protein
MLTYSPSIVAASAKVLQESPTPDVQVTFVPGSFKGGQICELKETPGGGYAWQMRPLSRGAALTTGWNRPQEQSRGATWRFRRSTYNIDRSNQSAQFYISNP